MKLKKGDIIKITVPPTELKSGWWAIGTVISATNYGDPNWYIEANMTNGQAIGYVYWKQAIDGGTVEKLSPSF